MPKTLQMLDAAHSDLVKRNTELGLPPAGGTATPNELEDLRECAKTALQRVLEKEMRAVLSQFSSFLTEKLINDLNVALQFVPPHAGHPSNSISVPIEECEEKLAGMLKNVHVVCLMYDPDDGTYIDEMVEWLRTALTRDDSDFKLSRFPHLVDMLLDQARNLLIPCANKYHITIIKDLQLLLGVTGTAVRIAHNNLHKLTTTVAVDSEKVVGAIVQRFAGPRVKVLKKDIIDGIPEVVCRALEANTVEACNAERLEIWQQVKRVEEAQAGIERISCMAVRLPHLIAKHTRFINTGVSSLQTRNLLTWRVPGAPLRHQRSC